MLWIVAAASAATLVDRSLDAPGEPTVSVSAPCGAIVISGTDRATVRVRGTVGDPEAFETSSVAGRVTVHVAEDGAARQGCVDLTLEVPAGASLDVEGVATSFTVGGMRADVAVNTVSGSVTVSGAPRSVEIETVSGSIGVTGAAQRLELEAVSGSVVAQGIGGVARMKSISGSLELVGGSPLADTELTTVSGTITFTGGLASAGRLEASTHSGTLRVCLPGDTDARLSQSTFSGQIRNVFGTGGELVLGAGKGRNELSTFSGDLDVQRP